MATQLQAPSCPHGAPCGGAAPGLRHCGVVPSNHGTFLWQVNWGCRERPWGRSVYFCSELYCIFRDSETHMDMTCSWGSGVLSFDIYIYVPWVRTHVLSCPGIIFTGLEMITFQSGDGYFFSSYLACCSMAHTCYRLKVLFMIKWLIYCHYRTSRKTSRWPGDSVFFTFIRWFSPMELCWVTRLLFAVLNSRVGELY